MHQRWKVVAAALAVTVGLPLAGCGGAEEEPEVVVDRGAAEEAPPAGLEEEPGWAGVPTIEELEVEPEVTGEAAEEVTGTPVDSLPAPAGEGTAPAAPPAAEEAPAWRAEQPSPAAPAPAPAPAPQPAPAAAAGQQVFLAQTCQRCHSVSTAGIEARVTTGSSAGGDLSASTAAAAAVRAVIEREQEVAGRTHPKQFTGAPEELQALVEWLMAQRR
ncbi:MAG TPA: c-type cytochrome [Thermoanaerobaculia bacterium]|nr:c-type cytochrome [Thermoanaerobaculia bacterium]